MAKKVALVTGASGFFGSHMVAALTAAGYEVRGTVRSLQDKSKVQHLQTLFPKLQIFQADLLIPGSFDKAVEGCDFVFHTASPFILTGIKDPVKELIEPAVQGTLNVLGSVDRSSTVQRVVITSSVAAVARGKPLSYAYSEKDWNEESSVDREPYAYSKKLAEESAWKFARGKKWELVVLNPSFIIGPPLSGRVDGISVQWIKRLIEGQHQDKTPGFALTVVDARDLATAHILAAEKAEAANQRFLVTGTKPVSLEAMRNMLVASGKFGKFPLDKNHFLPAQPRFTLNNEKSIKILGVKYRPNEETLVDMATALVDLGIVQIPSKL